MYFGLTDERRLLQATLRDFAARELPAVRRRRIFDAGTGFDPDLWRAAAELGVLGLAVPQRFGGAGQELLDLALAFEVLGEAALPGPFLGHALAALALVLAGSVAQRERWLPRLCSGEIVGTLAIGEPGDAWAPGAWTATGRAGTLSGAKIFVEGADRADVFVVGVAGGALAIVPRDAARVRSEAQDPLDRTRTLHRVAFDGAPADLLPGDREAAEALLDAARVLLAADAFGAAWKLIRLTVEYALVREQFGTPIAQFQAVKHQLANLAAETEPMRGLVWYAAHAFDHLPAERAREAAVAKAHVTERALHVGRSAVELHGGIGFTWDCDVQIWVKRTMFDRTWLGLPRVHRERVAALAGF
jgi:alkylation response protein AidB-like acyl-CoA dehydrogenase